MQPILEDFGLLILVAECPLMAISGLFGAVPRRSALPPKADIQIMIPSQAPADVRLAPNSGHKWLWRGMSAFDPKRTFIGLRGSVSAYTENQ